MSFLWLNALNAQDISLKDKLSKADTLRAESKFDLALSLIQEVKLEAQEKNDFEYVGRASYSTAAVYVELKNWDEAFVNYNEALDYALRINNLELRNRAAYGIGVVFQGKEQLDSAIYYFDKTVGFFKETGNTNMAAAVAYNMASIHRRQEYFPLAIERANEAIELYKSIGKYRWVGNSYYVLGNIYLNSGSYSNARDSFTNAYEIADSLAFPDNKGWALNGLARLEVKLANYEMAYEYMRQYWNVSRNIFTETNNDKLLELRAQYNTASLELDNERKENKILRQKRSQTFIIVIAIAILVAISIWLYIVDQRRKTIKALAEKNDEINKQKIDELLQEQEIASLQGVLEGQETERKRVAIDLHDRLGGILSMVKLHFSAVEEKIDPENPTKEKFLTASELLDLAAGEVRNISHNMMSGVLAKFGLIPALEDLKSRISETGKLEVNLYTANVSGVLDGEQELQLYRIVQELMSNILKHSEATETNIQLNDNEDSVNLIVEDNGVGFNPDKLSVKAGIGLVNLKARVAKLNGTLHIDSGLGAGTTISIDIPKAND